MKKRFYISIAIILILISSIGFFLWNDNHGQRRKEINDNLLKALIDDDLTKVKKMINDGADVNMKDSHNQTVLSYASSPDIVKALIENGADVNANSGGTTPLKSASTLGRLDVVRELLDKGADIDIRDNEYGQTALIAASIFDHLDIARELIGEGADMEIGDYSGKTALMWASDQGNILVVEELIRQGVNINRKNTSGNTALDFASGGGDKPGNPDIIKILKAAGAE